MKTIKGGQWGKLTRSDLSRSERIQKYVDESEMLLVRWPLDSATPDCIRIEIFGALAKIPSLKNSRPKWGGTNPVTVEKLKALDRLYEKQIEGVPIDYKDESVSLVVVCGDFQGGFDPSNVAETVKDWLEPKTKQVGSSKTNRDRGWGSGMVADDKTVTVYAVHAYQLGLNQKHTTILVKPWETVEGNSRSFVGAHHFLVASQ